MESCTYKVQNNKLILHETDDDIIMINYIVISGNAWEYWSLNQFWKIHIKLSEISLIF